MLDTEAINQRCIYQPGLGGYVVILDSNARRILVPIKYNFSNWLLENLQLSPLAICKSVFLHRHWTHSFNDQRAHSHDYLFLQQDDLITLESRNR